MNGLKLGEPFRVPYVLTSKFNAPRSYGNGLHEGVDYDVIAPSTNSQEPVLCLYDGVVYRSENNGTAYGNFVVVQHMFNGIIFYTWYCHMDSRYVLPGELVYKGQEVGELGGTGGFPEHVHLNLQVPGLGLSGYVVPDVLDISKYIS